MSKNIIYSVWSDLTEEHASVTDYKKESVKKYKHALIELKKKLYDLKMSSYVSELENPVQIRNTRRIIARLKTAKTKLNKDLIS